VVEVVIRTVVAVEVTVEIEVMTRVFVMPIKYPAPPPTRMTTTKSTVTTSPLIEVEQRWLSWIYACSRERSSSSGGVGRRLARYYIDFFLTKRYSKAIIAATPAIVVPSNTGSEDAVSVIVVVEKAVMVVG
jgi:hypothetical protein